MLLAALVAGAAGYAHAQEQTMVFSPTDPGITRSITNWGLDTCWINYDNMQRGLIYMGTNNVTLVRVGFFVDAPLTNNDVTPSDKSTMQTMASYAAMATAATKWDMNLASSVNSWYNSGANAIYPDRWAAAIEACQSYYNRGIWSVEGFNEPDLTSNNEGSPTDLYNVFGYLQSSGQFSGTYMAGGSTLNDDVATSWFNTISGRATMGSTHCLAGSAANYVSFMQTVSSAGKLPYNPEMHNVCEAMMGANYGMYAGIWWGTAELARGNFVKACQGSRLAYSEHQGNWTAASVYRGTDGSVQAFVGASERMAVTTTYRFVSKDRPLFFDGYGPRRTYAVTIPGGSGYQVNQPNAEKVVNITWGADAPPAINGRYIIVNRNSQLALEVPGSSTGNGTLLDQNTYSGGTNQQWDINPIPSTWGGDYSYFSIKAAHDGLNADNLNYSYASGNLIGQWNDGTNVVGQWYFQYAGNGYFKIRNKWSN
ncbi:MAG TPA: RICIN domain-containing protein, partial [Verrucomicrobiae bacterium]